MLLWSKGALVCVCVFVCMRLGGGGEGGRGRVKRSNPWVSADRGHSVNEPDVTAALCALCWVCTHAHTLSHTCRWRHTPSKGRELEGKQGWRTGGHIFRREGAKESIFDVVFVQWTAPSALKRSNASCNSTQQIQREIKEAKGRRRVGGGQREEEEGRGSKCVFCCQKGYCSVQIWALSQSHNQCASAWGASVRPCLCVCTSERRVCVCMNNLGPAARVCHIPTQGGRCRKTEALRCCV